MNIKAITAATLIAAGTAYGQGSDAILDLLIRKGIITQREANEVREQLDRQAAEAAEIYSKTKAATWLDALRFSGDLRPRLEYFDFEPGLNLPDRLRFRYRLRFGVEAQYRDWATVNFRLASGDGDPVSINQTISDAFRKKPLVIDIVSVTLTPPDQDFVKLLAGKMENPLWQPRLASPMVYDFDVTPEGVGEQLQWKFGEQGRLFANAGQFAIKEFGRDSNDAYLFDQQVGIEWRTPGKPPKLRVTAVGGYYFTHNLDVVRPGDSPNLGNLVRVTGTTTNYLADFHVIYARAEVAWRLWERPFLGTPGLLTLGGEYDENLESAFRDTTGWTAQLGFGEARTKGQWQVAYQYKYQEADSTWDAITDSDWGSGGTDRKGHVVRALYNLQDWWQLAFTAFVTEKVSARPNSGHNTRGLAGETLLRIQADTIFRF